MYAPFQSGFSHQAPELLREKMFSSVLFFIPEFLLTVDYVDNRMSIKSLLEQVAVGGISLANSKIARLLGHR
ncbi:MAG TPA: hypothetical protein DD379_13025 [Cyanobacteria bacterium UBA11162]|nr:hypothetical protein [Cyanobacteria bacterium UBA11162]